MYKFNIGESDELITITKKRMDAIKREVSDLQCELRGLKAGDNYLRVEEEHDGYFSSSHWEVISTEKLVYKLKNEVEKRGNYILSYQKKISTCRGHIERLINTSLFGFVRYKRSIRRDLKNRLKQLNEDR